MPKNQTKNSPYDEFRFFKNIYTLLNKEPEILLFGNKSDGLVHFKLQGDDELKSINIGVINQTSNFSKWMCDNEIMVVTQLATINKLAKCLKKNAVSAEEDDLGNFIFKFIEDDEEILIKIKNNSSLKKEVSMIASRENEKFSLDAFEVSEDFFKEELCRIYLQNGKPTLKVTSEKLLEIPSSKIVAISKKATKYELRFSQIPGTEIYKVIISSYSENLSFDTILAAILIRK